MNGSDAPRHVRGESRFLDDLPEPRGLLHAAVTASPMAHGRLRAVRTGAGTALAGVRAVLRAGDIPGQNQIGPILHDEVLLADEEVLFCGQPVALVLAEDRETAWRAAAAVELELEALPAILDAREAAARGSLIAPSRTLAAGDVDGAWEKCATVVEGRARSGAQEHLYLETQAALAIPGEGGRLHVFSSTQSPSGVQRAIARVLGLPMNAIEVEVKRLGGAFGGKEDQATAWAALAALGARATGRPVKLVLPRGADMRMTGKRHPYDYDFKLGLDGEGRFLALQATYYQNAGAAADLSTSILERSLLHATGAYFIPNVRVTGHACRTHLPPFTAFRGFGSPQAVFCIEAAIARAAEELGLPPWRLQERNLLRRGDRLPFGMRVQQGYARRSFRAAVRTAGLRRRGREIESFNRTHRLQKKGIAAIPICFGISFTSTPLNQAGALVHIYTDGSVSVSTGAVEMGQGVNVKLGRIAARTLGLPEERVSVESTNTTRVANAAPTAASTGADLNGMAIQSACRALTERLLRVAGELLAVPRGELLIRDGRLWHGEQARELTWETLVRETHRRRVNLSAQAFYATPRLHYDRERERGVPFAYHAFGAAVVEATIDGLRGSYTIDRVHVVHDAGRSLDPIIDRGQTEGALVQGIGWLTMEEVRYDEGGRLLTDSLTTYKVPDLHSVPDVLEVEFLADASNPHAVLHSKGIGEPPFLYGIGAYFALRRALRAFGGRRLTALEAPLTPERVLLALWGSATESEPG